MRQLLKVNIYKCVNLHKGCLKCPMDLIGIVLEVPPVTLDTRAVQVGRHCRRVIPVDCIAVPMEVVRHTPHTLPELDLGIAPDLDLPAACPVLGPHQEIT